MKHDQPQINTSVLYSTVLLPGYLGLVPVYLVGSFPRRWSLVCSILV